MVLPKLKKHLNKKNTLSDHDSIHGYRNLNDTERSLIARYRNHNAPKNCNITVHVQCRYWKQESTINEFISAWVVLDWGLVKSSWTCLDFFRIPDFKKVCVLLFATESPKRTLVEHEGKLEVTFPPCGRSDRLQRWSVCCTFQCWWQGSSLLFLCIVFSLSLSFFLRTFCRGCFLLLAILTKRWNVLIFVCFFSFFFFFLNSV